MGWFKRVKVEVVWMRQWDSLRAGGREGGVDLSDDVYYHYIDQLPL